MLFLITVNAIPHYSGCPSLQWMLSLITVDVLHYSGCCPSLQWMLSLITMDAVLYWLQPEQKGCKTEC